LDGNDEGLEKVYNSLYSLADFHDKRHFKSYDELKAKLDRVLGNTASTKKAEDYEPAPVAAAPEPKSAPAPKVSDEVSFDDDDDSLSFFEKLAEED
jgi:hypothetical protein